MTDEEMISEEKKKIAFIDTVSTIHPNTLEDDLNYYENFLIPGLQEQIEKQEKEIKLLKEQNEYVINEYGNTIEEQRKTIQAMAEQLAGLTIWDIEVDEPLILRNKEDVIKYFEKEGK